MSKKNVVFDFKKLLGNPISQKESVSH